MDHYPKNRNKSSKFVLSKGYSIRHFSRMKVEHKEVSQDEKVTSQRRQDLLTYPLQEHCIQLTEVGGFVFIFKELLCLIIKKLLILQLFLSIFEFFKYPKLGRKGRYFTKSVSGFD